MARIQDSFPACLALLNRARRTLFEVRSSAVLAARVSRERKGAPTKEAVDALIEQARKTEIQPSGETVVHALELNDDGHDVPPAPTALRAAIGLAEQGNSLR